MQIPAEIVERVNRIAQLQKDTHQVLGDRELDSLAIGKSIALRRKLESGAFAKVEHVCLAHNLRHAVPTNPQRNYTHLPKDFLAGDLNDLAALPDHCVYLLLNNDIGKYLPQYVELQSRRPNSLFVIWDWDSQHWLMMSCMLAASSDFYVPAASENLYTVSHFNPHLLGPAFAAVNQWSRRFIVEHMDVLLAARSDEPFGPHVPYGDFARRNRAVTTLNQTYQSIGFVDHGYQQKSDLDNLVEWARHKTHWIIPVLGGVPIRVYNSLLTGGIPVMPSHYRHMPEVLVFDDSPVFYDVIDLVDPREVQQQANARFDRDGAVGVARRIGSALEHQHIDGRCEALLQSLESAVQRIAGGSRLGSEGYLMNLDINPAARRNA